MGGTISLEATWTDDISDAATAGSCENAANGIVQDGLRYFLPRAPMTTSFGGHILTILGAISGYHGPGGYDAPALSGADGTQTIIAVDGAGWAAVNGGTAHVDITADDSGMLVYQKLAPTPPTPAPTVSGQPAPTAAPTRAGSITGVLSWTCVAVRSTATATPTPSPTPSPTPAPTPSPTPVHKPTPTPHR